MPIDFPSGPTTGQLYTYQGKYWVYNGTAWDVVSYSDAQTILVPYFGYLVIAGGGGGGGSHAGGGGGAGGYRTNFGNTGGGVGFSSPFGLQLQTNYVVTVGAGGTAGGNGNTGAFLPTSGVNSTFSTITSTGGGRGAVEAAFPGNTGGSGGGGAGDFTAANRLAGAGAIAQGFTGGAGSNDVSGGYGIGGGGGGAGAVGAPAAGSGGAGGAGVASSITGTLVTRAGGGSGGSWGAQGRGGGAGGAGGGGGVGTAGTVNTGSGGGGSDASGSRVGGAGGSGLVVLRYPASITITIGAGLTSSTATIGSDRVTTFTAGTGNVSWA